MGFRERLIEFLEKDAQENAEESTEEAKVDTVENQDDSESTSGQASTESTEEVQEASNSDSATNSEVIELRKKVADMEAAQKGPSPLPKASKAPSKGSEQESIIAALRKEYPDDDINAYKVGEIYGEDRY